MILADPQESTSVNATSWNQTNFSELLYQEKIVLNELLYKYKVVPSGNLSNMEIQIQKATSNFKPKTLILQGLYTCLPLTSRGVLHLEEL